MQALFSISLTVLFIRQIHISSTHLNQTEVLHPPSHLRHCLTILLQSFCPHKLRILLTLYQYDISEWIEDCLDEIDMREQYDVLLMMCDTLLSLFSWPDYTGSDLKFRKSSVLEALGRNKEAVSFCCKWFEKELENIMAATAYAFALIVPKEAAGNEHLMMISQLATNLLEDEFRDEVKSATDKSVLKEYILKNMKENN